MIDMDAFETSVMQEFDVTRHTAHQWIMDGMAMAAGNHEIMIKQEKAIRGLTAKPKEMIEAEKEAELIIKKHLPEENKSEEPKGAKS